jgi:uncharacterized damage-inducible protein DinB
MTNDAIELIRRLWSHAEWADELVRVALPSRTEAPTAWREYLHVLGAEAVWLARLEGRKPLVPVWPELDAAGGDALRDQVRSGYDAYLARLDDAELARVVTYTTSDGREFRSAVGDMLLQVALHGQYHRGKVNILLRQDGFEPAPVDWIAYVRGSPAARTPVG